MSGQEDQITLTAEELDKLSSDNEGGPAAKLGGWLGWVTSAVMLGLSAYALYWTQFAVNTTFYRVSFLGVVLGLVFLLYPLVRGARPEPRVATIEECLSAAIGVTLCGVLAWESDIIGKSWWVSLQLSLVALCFGLMPLSTRSRLLSRSRALDWILVAFSIGIACYLALFIEDYKARPTKPTPEELVLGGTLILLILEASRRTIGWVLPAIAVCFLLYCTFGPYVPEPFDHRGFSINRIIGQNALTLEGIFSTPLDVAATFIIL